MYDVCIYLGSIKNVIIHRAYRPTLLHEADSHRVLKTQEITSLSSLHSTGITTWQILIKYLLQAEEIKKTHASVKAYIYLYARIYRLMVVDSGRICT